MADDLSAASVSSHPDSDELLEDSEPVVEMPAAHPDLHDEISHILNRNGARPRDHHAHSTHDTGQAHRQRPSNQSPLASLREDFNRLIDDQAAYVKFEVRAHLSTGPHRAAALSRALPS